MYFRSKIKQTLNIQIIQCLQMLFVHKMMQERLKHDDVIDVEAVGHRLSFRHYLRSKMTMKTIVCGFDFVAM